MGLWSRLLPPPPSLEEAMPLLLDSLSSLKAYAMFLSALDERLMASPAESLLLCVDPSITSLRAIANLAASPARTLISMECCAPSLVLNVNTVVWNSV